MAAIEAVGTIEHLREGDADAGLALSREAGWNQTRDDWLQFLLAGTVFGLRDDDGVLVATAALLPAPPVTWISMVLVTARMRRRGLADALMRRCIDAAGEHGLEPWLDATPAGAAVYGRMGFSATGFDLARIRRLALGGQASSMSEGDESRIAAFVAQDRDAMGFDRSPLLGSLVRRTGSVLYRTGDAFALVRDGDHARHIGPVFAESDEAAVGLLDRILVQERDTLLIDVATRAIRVADFLAAKGFAVERPFTRMRLGASRIDTPHNSLIAACGPEYG